MMGTIYKSDDGRMLSVGEATGSSVKGEYIQHDFGGSRKFVYSVSKSLTVTKGAFPEQITVGEMDKYGNVYRGSKYSGERIGEVDNGGNVYKVSGNSRELVGKVSFRDLRELAGGAVFLLVYLEDKEREKNSYYCPKCGSPLDPIRVATGDPEPCTVCWYRKHSGLSR